jgi:pimeloyl-ACP methyl ester carboxylesterase
MPRFRRPNLLVVALTLALLAVPLRGAVAQEATPEPRFTNTVDIGGRNIGLTCEGDGSPTVLLIGGAISPADRVWPETVDALSPTTRVCAFDRAGLGASDPQPSSPQTAADVVADLHGALEAAGEAGPFVPVGFSFGGLVAQLFASTYPDQLAGLVLVEGSPPGWSVVDMFLLPWPEADRKAIRDLVTGRDPEQPASPLDVLTSGTQVLAAVPPPPVPTVMIVAAKTDFWLVPPEGNVTWYDLEFAASFVRQQAAQARDLGAQIVVAEDRGWRRVVMTQAGQPRAFQGIGSATRFAFRDKLKTRSDREISRSDLVLL